MPVSSEFEAKNGAVLLVIRLNIAVRQVNRSNSHYELIGSRVSGSTKKYFLSINATKKCLFVIVHALRFPGNV